MHHNRLCWVTVVISETKRPVLLSMSATATVPQIQLYFSCSCGVLQSTLPAKSGFGQNSSPLSSATSSPVKSATLARDVPEITVIMESSEVRPWVTKNEMQWSLSLSHVHTPINRCLL